MVNENPIFPSTFTIENYSSTVTLARNDQFKIPIKSSIETLKEKEYNQYEHRSLDHPNTFYGALVHLIKSSLGTGILAMPRAFKHGGLIVGSIGTLLIGFLCTHTVNLLVRASQEMCVKTKTPSLGYAETAEEVFKNGPKGFRRWSGFAKNFVRIALVLTYSLGGSVYIVFISESITKLLAYYYTPAADDSWSQYVKLIILLPLILCCQIRELKHLVPFSFIANLTLSVAFSITLWYTFSKAKDVDLADRNLTTSLSGIPSFFSTVIFAMEGIGTIMPVENTMITPQFVSVVNAGMVVIVALFGAIGLFGYYAYGEATMATITQNLPSEEVPAQVVQACISTAVFFTFMLQFYVPTDITWRKIRNKIPEEKQNMAQIILRTSLVLFIVGIAAAAGHHLDALIDLAGAIFLSTLGLLIPALLDIINKWGNWGRLNWILMKNLLIAGCSFFGLLSGSYYAILEFIQ